MQLINPALGSVSVSNHAYQRLTERGLQRVGELFTRARQVGTDRWVDPEGNTYIVNPTSNTLVTVYNARALKRAGIRHLRRNQRSRSI